MRKFPTIAALFAIFFLTATTEAQKEKPPQEAAPVIAVFSAVKASDIRAFKNAYCERIRDDTDQGNWEKNMKEAQANLKKLYGEYDLKDFAFTFVGDAEKGKVSVTHKGKKSVALGVIQENGAWKISER